MDYFYNGLVDSLFDHISHFQILHPDPIREEEKEDDGMFMTANGWVSIEDHVCALFDKAAVLYYSNCIRRIINRRNMKRITHNSCIL